MGEQFKEIDLIKGMVYIAFSLVFVNSAYSKSSHLAHAQREDSFDTVDESAELPVSESHESSVADGVEHEAVPVVESEDQHDFHKSPSENHQQAQHASEKSEKEMRQKVALDGKGRKKAPCAVLKDFNGVVQLLDESQQEVVDVLMNTEISCESWLSVEDGWAVLKHRDGYEIHISSGSFLEIRDGNPRAKFSGDHLILYRGQVYVKADGLQAPFNIVTPNTRTKVDRGRAIVYFDNKEGETKLISLFGDSYLENRFDQRKSIKVGPGEMSTLSLDYDRVLPQTPKVVTLALVKPKLYDLHLPEVAQKHAIRMVLARQERKLASYLVEPRVRRAIRDGSRMKRKHTDTLSQEEIQKNKVLEKQKREEYERHEIGDQIETAHEVFVNKLTGGDEGAGEDSLFPGEEQREPASTAELQESLDDPGLLFWKKKKRMEELEKKKVLKRLLRLKPKKE